jgi:hypothetical protein
MYVHIITPKVHVSTTFITLSIFVTYPKEKMKDFFFFFFFNLGTQAAVPQGYKYPKKYLVRVRLHF